MAVYVTGDIHGNPVRLSTDSFYEQKDFSGNKDDNTVIILGDFGLVWNKDNESKQEKYWLDWLNNKPFITVFIDLPFSQNIVGNNHIIYHGLKLVINIKVKIRW